MQQSACLAFPAFPALARKKFFFTMTSNFSFVACATFLCLLNLIIGVTNGVPVNAKRTCIMGAGYSGLATARHLKRNGVENFVILEATRHIGGTWRFDPNVGVDQDGVPLLTSNYKYLRTNTPRQTMEFSGFPFPEGSPSYPSGTCFYKYLKYFAKFYDLGKHVQFRSYVTSVHRIKDHWDVTYTNTETNSTQTDRCDFVVVANGHYSLPRWPKFEGDEKFKGKIMHSHDYKQPEDFANQRVLLVGAGPSGLDLASHLANKTAKLVHSHHLTYNQPFFSENYVKKPDIAMFTETGVLFEDGTYEEVDSVIYCTGFDFEHPFIDKSAGVTVSRKFILPLYQQIVNIRYPSMFFVGIAKVTITRLLDVQAEYAANAIAGKFQLPDQDKMLKNWIEFVYFLQSRGKKIVDVNYVGHLQDQYFGNLTLEGGVTRAAPVLTDIRDFNAKIRLDDLLHYRDYEFKLIDEHTYERIYQPMGDVCPIGVE